MLPSPANQAPLRQGRRLAGWRRQLLRRAPLLLTLLFWLLLLAMFARSLPRLELPAILQGLRSHDARSLWLALLCSAFSYVAASCYDLLARSYAGSRVPPLRTVLINTLAYAASLNIGALLGGWGLRLRLYTRQGLQPAQIAQIITMAMFANWSGFLLLAAALLLLAPAWPAAPLLARAFGACLLLLLFALYRWGGRQRPLLRLLRRGPQLRLPHLPNTRDALLLSLASLGNWVLMACALRLLLPAGLQFAEVLKMLLLSSIAALLLRVPGGIGVMEGSFAYLLAGRYAPASIIASVLVFRALYYWLPFALAMPLYLRLELQSADARRHDF